MDRFNYNQPNSRERVAARKRAATGSSSKRRVGSKPQVTPGPRRTLESWWLSGRLISLVLLLASLIGFLIISRDSRYTIRNIQVTGVHTLKAQDVAQIADIYNVSTWLVDTDVVAERLLSNAYIEHVEVYVSLPDQLKIIVQERTPDIQWRSGGETYVLDVEGRVLSTADVITMTNALVIEDRSNQLLQPNDVVNPAVLDLGRALALRLPAELHITPSSIGWDVNEGMIVTTADNRVIMFGRTPDLDEKFEILRTLLNDGTQFTMLDLRPNTPFYRNDAPS
jgi:cell division protein FtsQ